MNRNYTTRSIITPRFRDGTEDLSVRPQRRLEGLLFELQYFNSQNANDTLEKKQSRCLIRTCNSACADMLRPTMWHQQLMIGSKSVEVFANTLECASILHEQMDLISSQLSGIYPNTDANLVCTETTLKLLLNGQARCAGNLPKDAWTNAEKELSIEDVASGRLSTSGLVLLE